MSFRCDGNPVVVEKTGGTKRLERLTFGDREIDEGWLQNLMHDNPGILPVNDFDPGFGPLIPIGREIGTDVGPIDNLFVSPTGLLTIVEAKLWRNPQARREVVGQVIDYAKEVSRWGYEELDASTRKASGKSLWELVTGASEPILDEPQFIDTVARNLQAGRFLLLIVGDGIREEMERMAEYLQGTPQLRFSLALVELQVYRLAEEGDLLVTPVIVSRTREISRAIVRVTGDATAKVDVSLDLTDVNSSVGSPPRRVMTYQTFFQELEAKGVSAEGIRVAQRFHDDFDQDERFQIDWKSASFTIKMLDPANPRTRYTILVVNRTGTAYIGWLGLQFENSGIAYDYEFSKATGKLLGCNPKSEDPDTWDATVTLEELAGVYGAFKACIEELAANVSRQRTAVEE